VFVATKNKISRCFVGTASPLQICKQLAITYPWLEAAFIKVYASIAPDPKTTNNPYELSEIAESNSWQISELVRKYIEEIQQQFEPDTFTKDEWVTFGDPIITWERTNWLGQNHVEEVLASDLCTSSFVDLPDQDTKKKIQALLRRPGEFVALTDEKERFKDLIDRLELLEKVVKEIN
jgi:hypothetical protein